MSSTEIWPLRWDSPTLTLLCNVIQRTHLSYRPKMLKPFRRLCERKEMLKPFRKLCYSRTPSCRRTCSSSTRCTKAPSSASAFPTAAQLWTRSAIPLFSTKNSISKLFRSPITRKKRRFRKETVFPTGSCKWMKRSQKASRLEEVIEHEFTLRSISFVMRWLNLILLSFWFVR